jgi:hypothetical protein
MILDPSTNEIEAVAKALETAAPFVNLSWRELAKLMLVEAAKTRKLSRGTVAEAAIEMCDAFSRFRRAVPDDQWEKLPELARAGVDLAQVEMRRALAEEQAKQTEMA